MTPEFSPTGGTDPTLDTLLLPLDTRALALAADAPVLFLRARFGAALCHRPLQQWTFEQSFRPHADALERAGLAVGAAAPDARYALVAALPPRQREEARALLARAVLHAADGGVVLASVANNEGARSCAADLERLAGPLSTLSKHKCRAFWTQPLRAGAIDQALCAEWLALDAPRPVAGGFVSRPGLFAWDRVDPASALLAGQLPATLAGRVADLGGGYGYLSAHLLRACPQVTHVDLYEAEARALEPAQVNLEAARDARPHDAAAAGFALHWHDVTRGLSQRFDAIVSNPPFHVGRADRPQLGRAFIHAAADALLPDGVLWLVANRHLPYEKALAERFASFRVAAVGSGFKVFETRGVHA